MKNAKKVKALKKQIKNLKAENKQLRRHNMDLLLQADEIEENRALIDELQETKEQLRADLSHWIKKAEYWMEDSAKNRKYELKYEKLKIRLSKINEQAVY